MISRLGRQAIEELIQFLFTQTFGHVGQRLFPLRDRSELGRGLNYMGRQKNDEFGLSVIFLRAPEKVAEERDVAKKRNFGYCGYLGALHQAPEDYGLPVGRDGDRISRTGIDDRRVDSCGNRNLDSRVNG